MAAARAVVVNGPRQSGKTELLRAASARAGGTYLTLDVPEQLGAARRDPRGFLERESGPLFVDEVQRGGDPLLLAVKVAVDERRTRGQFCLAGSTRFLTEPRLSESLAGRVRFVDLWPLSQGEMRAGADAFVDLLANGTEALRDAAAGGPIEVLKRGDIARILCRGGFPEAALHGSVADAQDFLDDYVRTVTQRDVRELARIQMADDLPRIMSLLAARTAQVINVSALANDAGLGGETTRRYLPLLETVFLFHRLPAMANSPTTRQKRAAKLHFVDVGLAAALLRQTPDALARPENPWLGHLFETFVVGELARQLTWSQTRATLSHWQDREGREVDAVLELGPNRIVGIEVKGARDVSDHDVRHLIHLRDRLGDSFVHGVVIHLGDRVQPLGDRLTAVPVAALWQASL
jgi:uncharacterized protein